MLKRVTRSAEPIDVDSSTLPDSGLPPTASGGGRPLSEPGAARRVLPFAAAAGLALGSLVLPAAVRVTASALEGATLLVAIAVATMFVPWRRLPAWAEAGPPIAFFGAVALLRDAQGGAVSGFGALLLLPVIWLALYGTRRQVAVSVVGAVLAMALPLVVIGAPRYPSYGWRPALLLAVVACMIGVAVSRLVAELRAREQVTAEVVQRLEGILAAATEYSVIGTDGQGRITAFNVGAERMLGYRADEMLGRVPDLLHDRAELAARAAELGTEPSFDVLAHVARSGVAERRRWTYVRKDGSRLPVDLTVTAIRAADGRVTGFIGIGEDVSDRLRAEQALRDSETNLAATARVVREIQSGADPRETIVAAVGEIAGADLAYLFEPEGPDLLRLTAGHGGESPARLIALDGQPSGTVTAFRTGQRVFCADAQNDPTVARAMARAMQVRSVLFEPVRRDERVVGVLLAAWRDSVPDLESRRASAVGLLAVEAGVALERESMLKRLVELAATDALTGLPNRRAWDDLLTRAIAGARRSGQPLAVAMLDIDHFKAFNDREGHAAGDQLLAAFAENGRRLLRTTDVMARWGGEEFALLLPGCSLQDAWDVAARLRRTMPGGQTCSAGLAMYDGVEDADSLVARADRALYAAKAGGRDRAEVDTFAPPARAGGLA